MQKLGAPCEEGDDFFIDAILKRPAAEALEMGHHGDMDEAVLQGGWHAENRGAILGTIPGGPDMPSLRQRVGADLAVEDELLRDALDGWRCHVQLVEEKNTRAAAWKEFRRIPARSAGIMVGHRKTAQVGRGELADAEVDEVDLCRLCDGSDGVGFSDAGRAPDHDGLEEVFFNESAEQVFEL